MLHYILQYNFMVQFTVRISRSTAINNNVIATRAFSTIAELFVTFMTLCRYVSLFQANEVFNMYSNSTDYTGVLVSARKPVAVFGGCDCVNIPDRVDFCDHIMAQV